MTEQQPQMNGPAEGSRYIDTIDPEDPEYIRQMLRPADVKEDVKQMEQRSRVSQILQSQAFREELEQLINENIRTGGHSASLLALRQISELIMPQSRFNQAGGVFSKGGGPVIPIADIRGVDSMNYTKGEKILRCKVAGCYRLVDLFGWSHGIDSHITARVSQEHEHFLINPYGMLYHEVSASSLVKVDMRGEIVDPGTTSLGVNKAAFSLHSAIHAARPDIKVIIHLKTPAAVSVSAMKCGLLPMSTEAIVIGECSFFDYYGSLTDQEERDHLARALGPRNKVLFLRNQGVMACGESTDEAFHIACSVMTACETQMRTIPIGLDNIALPSEDTQRRIREAAVAQGGGGDATEGKKKWRKGEREYEALMRHLDNAGYRTGYIYREPLLRQDRRMTRANSDVEVPPASSSFAYMWDDERSQFSSPLKQHMDRHKKAFKSEWLATPNVYKREEIEETGTPNPKKITKVRK